MKKRFTLTLIILLSLTLVGCRENSTSQQTKSTDSSQATAVSTTNSQEKTTQVKMMNMEEIQKGNYQSITGQWQAVAINVNYFDGEGYVWLPPRQSKELEVSDTQIVNGGIKLASNQLEVNGEAVPVEFQSQEEKLFVHANQGALRYGIYFYPKNVSINSGDDAEVLPKTIDPQREHIAVYIHAGRIMTVYERVESKKDLDKMNHIENKGFAMDLSGITEGDFSTIAGTWKNNQNQTVKITKNKMEIADIGYQEEKVSAIIENMQLTIPEWTEADGTIQTRELIAGPGQKYDRTLQVQKGHSDSDWNSWGFEGNIPFSPLYILVIPKNDSLNTIGQFSEDTLVIQATPSNFTSNAYYHRVSD